MGSGNNTDLEQLLGQPPQPTQGIDVLKLAINAQEGFVWSRIDGKTTAQTICDLVGLEVPQVIAALEHLEELGAIEWAGNGQKSLQNDLGSHDKAAPDKAIEAALSEECDLSRAEKLRIMVALRDQASGNHWLTLGLRGNPSSADIKKNFFELSKMFHPDRFFGKDLGAFAGRLEQIFHTIKQAYDILGHEKRCAVYRLKVPPPKDRPKSVPLNKFGKARGGQGKAKQRPLTQKAEQEKSERLAKRRAQMIANRKSKVNQPVKEREGKAKTYYERGIEQLRAKDIVGAASSFQLAVSYDPNNAEYQARYEEVGAVATTKRARSLVDAAIIEQASGMAAAAARLYAQASDLVPTMASYALSAAGCFETAGNNEQALLYLDRAVKASPRRCDVRVMFARCLEEAGDREGALAHLEIAASLDKADVHVKKELKRLAKCMR